VSPLGFVVNDALLPKGRSGRAIEAHEGAVVFRLDDLSQEDAIFPDDRGGIAAVGQIDAPEHVLGLAPGGRRVGFAGNAGAGDVAAPGGPIGGRGGGDEIQDCEGNEREEKLLLHGCNSFFEGSLVASGRRENKYIPAPMRVGMAPRMRSFPA
jgi:hypothetical protein